MHITSDPSLNDQQKQAVNEVSNLLKHCSSRRWTTSIIKPALYEKHH
jgi:hypothetical protein